MPRNRMQREEHSFISVIFLSKTQEFNHEETTDKPKLRDILQNNWLVVIRSVKIMKIKERLRNCSRLKETKYTYLNAMSNSELESSPQMDIPRETGET